MVDRTFSLANLVSSILKCEMTSQQIVEKAIARYEETVTFNAFVTLNKDAVIRQAIESDHRRENGNALSVIDGIPVAVKDNYWTADHPTTACSKAAPVIPKGQDATVVRKMRNAGAIIFGKTNMHEWAYGATNATSTIGPTKHPKNVEHTTGGSSGGSAVAVANGVVGAALGSDTGGSVRIPSAACGLVGFKPSYGRASRHGVLPLSWSLDAPGLLATSMADIVLLAPYLLGEDVNDPSTIGAKCFNPDVMAHGTKLLSLTGSFLERREDVEYVIQSCFQKLSGDFDCTVAEVQNMESYFAAWEAILHAEASSYHYELLKENPDGFSDITLSHLVAGAELLAVEYLDAQKLRHKFLHLMSQLFSKADILVLPALPVTAPKHGDGWQEFAGRRVTTQDSMTWFCWLANLAGLPSITLPVGLAENGFPVGFMMMGKPGEDEILLNTAQRIQGVLEYHRVQEVA